jgi:hypothetical protein
MSEDISKFRPQPKWMGLSTSRDRLQQQGRDRLRQTDYRGINVSSDDLIRYVEGSLIQDIDRYNQVEEAICKDLDLYNECIDLREKIWLTGQESTMVSRSDENQCELSFLRFSTQKASDRLPAAEELSAVSTDDLIRYVEGSLLADLGRYHHVEEAICKNNDLYEECVRLRKLIWGA